MQLPVHWLHFHPLTLTMAVLKSPKNVRKKGFWALKYSVSQSPSFRRLADRRRLRSTHRLTNFLIDSAYWLSTQSLSYRVHKRKNPDKLGTRPSHIVTYGHKSFDSSVTYPVVFSRHIRARSSRARLMSVLNADELAFSEV